MLITEIKGASLLPVRKDEGALAPGLIPDSVYGFNSAVTQLEQCSVEVDEEELCEFLYNYIDGERLEKDMLAILEQKPNRTATEIKCISGATRIKCRMLSKALSKCKQNWLRLERNV